jgi:hypothetical protein
MLLPAQYPPFPLSPMDCQQVFIFTNGVEFHQRAACCAMPPSIFLDAVLLAQREKGGCLDFEAYPSVKLICDWWNENNPGRMHEAAFFYFNVRVEDNNIYFAGHSETPASYSYVFADTTSYGARVGDHILIEFFALAPSLSGDQFGYLPTSVDGDAIWYDLGWVGHGFPHGSYDTWHSLRDFPQQFSTLFQYLQFQSSNEKATSTLLPRPDSLEIYPPCSA